MADEKEERGWDAIRARFARQEAELGRLRAQIENVDAILRSRDDDALVRVGDIAVALDVDGRVGVAQEVAEQRRRHHLRWGTQSIEGRPWGYYGWLPTLVEEVGEVARAMQEGRVEKVRAESLDVLAVCWMLIDAIDGEIP